MCQTTIQMSFPYKCWRYAISVMGQKGREGGGEMNTQSDKEAVGPGGDAS